MLDFKTKRMPKNWHVIFLTSKNSRKGLCNALIFNKKFEGCSLEIDLMKKGLRQDD